MQNTRPISAIKVIDLKSQGNGATAKIEHGGLGATSVSIKLKSQFNHGIKNQILVYTL